MAKRAYGEAHVAELEPGPEAFRLYLLKKPGLTEDEMHRITSGAFNAGPDWMFECELRGLVTSETINVDSFIATVKHKRGEEFGEKLQREVDARKSAMSRHSIDHPRIDMHIIRQMDAELAEKPAKKSAFRRM